MDIFVVLTFLLYLVVMVLVGFLLKIDVKVFFFYSFVGFALLFSVWFINAGYLGVNDNNDPNSYTTLRVVSGLEEPGGESDIYMVSDGLEGIFIGYDSNGTLVIKVDEGLLIGDDGKLDSLLDSVLDLLVVKDLLVIDKGLVENL